ncbi:MAG: ankyrin repeat domain-containing protein [Rheinheimera sp.]|nr:ankyrin repeat domain-containing protein [Rheinheimera sp.]
MKYWLVPIFVFILCISGCSGVGLSRLINTGDYEALSKLSYDEINEVTFDSTVLSRFVMHGENNVEKLKILLKYKADPNINISARPLAQSVIRSNYEFTKELIAHGANLDYADFYGKTALHYAVQNNDQQMVQLLISSGAKTGFLTKNYSSPNQNGVSELAVAVINGNQNIVKILIDNGTDPNIAGENLGFPILEAVYKNEYSIVSYLIAAGADVNKKIHMDYQRFTCQL